MARRSQAAVDFPKQVNDIKTLLDTFLDRIEHDDMRQQVRSLIPAIHALRDLGSGLIKGEGIAAGRDRILAYLRKYPRTVIEGDELMVVGGIGEWARRARELRVELGWAIYTGATFRDQIEETPELIEDLQKIIGQDPRKLKPTDYVLMKDEQDREAALRWNQLKTIRNKGGGVKSKILEYLRLNVGRVVTGEELRYLAKDRKEWARRSRELRTQDGWPVLTRMQGRPDLGVGEYLLEEDRQAPEHDRRISDDVRVKVLERDKFRCVFCKWGREDLRPDDPRKFLELHHVYDHAKGGENTVDNLATLCNVHHDQVHKGKLEWTGGKWAEK